MIDRLIAPNPRASKNRSRIFKAPAYRPLVSSLLAIASLFFVTTTHSENLAKHPATNAIASANPLATNAGLEILAQGGNAFDAAIAVSAALAVVEPYHTGLGGGGFWLLHDGKSHRNIFIDGREVAPKSASASLYLNSNGELLPGKSLNGGLAAAIPGEPAALVLLAERYGRLPLSKSLQPAISLADNGIKIDHLFYSFLMMGDRAEQLKKYPASKALFIVDDKPLAMGQQLLQKDLANTLRLLAEKGVDGFYRGYVAEHLVESVNRAGGVWTLDDLANYRVKARLPLESYYHKMHIVTAPLPSAGGVGLITMLNIVSAYKLPSLLKVESVHYLVEAMRLAYWQRSEFLGDTDFVTVPLKRLLSIGNAGYLRSFIKANEATASKTLPDKSSSPLTPSNTTHFSIIDKEGNRVAATLSLNYIFGSSVVAEGTGVLLNDHMDDFSIKTDIKNVFGLSGSRKNAIAPGKRPLSSMTPTFLELPGRVAILGTPGGSRIPSMVLLASLVFERGYGAISMVSTMRFHHQYLPDKLQFEPNTFIPALQKKLQRMGYQLEALANYYGDMQAITWDRQSNLVTAAADPRRIGLGAVVKN